MGGGCDGPSVARPSTPTAAVAPLDASPSVFGSTFTPVEFSPDAELDLQIAALKSEEPAQRARAIVEATTYFKDPEVLAKVSRGLGDPMRGMDLREIPVEERLAPRGW